MDLFDNVFFSCGSKLGFTFLTICLYDLLNTSQCNPYFSLYSAITILSYHGIAQLTISISTTLLNRFVLKLSGLDPNKSVTVF